MSKKKGNVAHHLMCCSCTIRERTNHQGLLIILGIITLIKLFN